MRRDLRLMQVEVYAPRVPAITPIAVYPVKIDGGDVFVSVTKEN